MRITDVLTVAMLGFSALACQRPLQAQVGPVGPQAIENNTGYSGYGQPNYGGYGAGLYSSYNGPSPAYTGGYAGTYGGTYGGINSGGFNTPNGASYYGFGHGPYGYNGHPSAPGYNGYGLTPGGFNNQAWGMDVPNVYGNYGSMYGGGGFYYAPSNNRSFGFGSSGDQYFRKGSPYSRF